MKKTNKKGFTLIELLAVIIILGVIMLIAIPSVTQQITNSRRSSYSDTLQSYIQAVVTEVNEGTIPMYDGTAVYAIPVGHNATYSCVDLESGGASPFNKEFKYGYVFARYTGSSYNDWITMVDGSNQGALTVASKTLEKEGSKHIHSNISGNKVLITTYNHSSFVATGSTITEAQENSADMITLDAYKPYFNHILTVDAIDGAKATTTDTNGSDAETDWDAVVSGTNNGGQDATHVYFVKPSACRD